jgi:hypothetical protein
MTYFDMSSKLKRVLSEEEERCCGEGPCFELGRCPPTEIREELDRRDDGSSSPSAGIGVNDFGEEVMDKLRTGPAGEVAMRPSGT